jgi:hypothetical protein
MYRQYKIEETTLINTVVSDWLPFAVVPEETPVFVASLHSWSSTENSWLCDGYVAGAG